MHNEFTALIEKDEGWYIAYCSEMPGTNGQGKTKEECLKSLSEAIKLILEDRRQDAMLSVFEYIVVFYNHKRRHSALGYKSPVEFERLQYAA